MNESYGHFSEGGGLVLHGGAGGHDPKAPEAVEQATRSLIAIGKSLIDAMQRGLPPLQVVVDGLGAMEDDQQFNAGFGAALQADGQARLTAAIMDGTRQRFSAVMGSTDLRHPSRLAASLQERDARVLCPPGVELLARELRLPVESVVTTERLRRWWERASQPPAACDTVGVVLRLGTGALFAGTSTGGRGNECPGRVSDSGTVAGTYCSEFAGVSATGVGEQIVDDALAARLESRRRDGLTLAAASQRCFAEARARQRSYGWIALDREGHWAVAHTTPAMSFAVLGADGRVFAAWGGLKD